MRHGIFCTFIALFVGVAFGFGSSAVTDSYAAPIAVGVVVTLLCVYLLDENSSLLRKLSTWHTKLSEEVDQLIKP